MKTAKRILAVMLSVILAFSAFSLAVSAEPVGDPEIGTADFGLNFYKITTDGGGNEVKTPLAKSGAALSTGDIVEIGLSIATDFYTFAVYTQIWYDKTVFSPCYNGVADTTTKFNNVFKNQVPPFATLADASTLPKAQDIYGYEWNYFETCNPNIGYTGLCNFNNLVAQQFPYAWKVGTTVKPEYTNMNFVSLNIATTKDGSASGGMLIKIPEAEYASFRLIVTADSETTTSSTISIPYDAVYQDVNWSSNRVYVSSIDDGTSVGHVPVSLGHYIDLEDATATFAINQAASTYTARFFEQDGTTELTSLAIPDIESGDSITLPEGPVIEGYDFDYWTIGANTYNAGSTFEVTEDVDFVAHYTAKTQYTVTFVSNNTSYGTITGTSSVQVYSGTPWNEAWYPSYQAAPGYKFDNWTGAVATVTSNVTVTANFSYDATQWATIYFASGPNGTIEAIAPQTVLKGTAWEAITEPATYPADGFVFDKWTPDLPSDSDIITADSTYTATFKPGEASYNVEVYRMNTSGTYDSPEIYPYTGTVGETVSVNPESYVTLGFDVNEGLTVDSAVLAPSGTVLKVYLDRITVYYTYKYYDYAADNGTYIQFQQDAYLYGQTITLPATTPDASLYSKEFEAWHVGSVEGPVFTGGTASANTDIYASFADVNTELDYTPITNAIEALPTTLNLYYYTDEAIIMVAAALNQTITAAEIPDFLATPYAYKNMTSSFTTQAQVLAAADNILNVLATINTEVGSGASYNMPYRAEWKANVKYFVRADNYYPEAGDIVTFTVSVYTDFLLYTMLMGVVYDADTFDFVNTQGTVYTKENLGSVNVGTRAIKTDVAPDEIVDEYDIDCLTVNPTPVKYPTSYQTTEFMSRYKMVLTMVSTVGAPYSTILTFGASDAPVDLFTFRLKVKDTIPSDGSTTTVGFIDDWFPTILTESGSSTAVVRAVGSKVILPYDICAQFGQTFSSENAVLTFGAPACEHEWGPWTADANGTTHSRTCLLCSEVETADHSGGTATCNALAVCEICGEPYGTYNANNHGSNGSTLDPATVVAATCTTAGYTGDYKCDGCGVVVTTGSVIPALGHDWGDWVYDGAEDKTHTRTCANDASHTETEACTFDVGVVTTPPTCTEAGVMTYTCTVCGGTYTEEIPALGHDWGDWVYDGTEAKTHTRTCANDPSHTETEACTFDAGVVTLAPTVTEDGVMTYTCSVCGGTYTEVIPALGYDWSDWSYNGSEAKTHTRYNQNDPEQTETEACTFDAGVVTTPATCTAAGVMTYTCSVCGGTYTEEIPALGHDWGDWVYDGAEAKTHTRTCANDASHTETEACTFDVGVVTTPPTCTEAGVMTYTCSVCGGTYTEAIPALGHDWGDWAYDGEAVKTHTRTCATDPSHTETEACAFDDGVVTLEPTVTEDGIKTYTCSVCGGTYTEVIPHIAERNVLEATLENDGFINIVVLKMNGVGPVKIQLRLNGSTSSTCTFTRASATIEDVEMYGAACELWKIPKNNIADGSYIVIAKYFMSQDINAISNDTGCELLIDTYVEPVYDDDVYAAVVEGLDESDSMYFTAAGQTMKFYTGLDVYKIQLLDNVTLGTLTYTKTTAGVTVENGTYEGVPCLVWTINKVFGISSYDFSVYARSPLGMFDSELDLVFSIKAVPVEPSENAFVSVAIDDDTIDLGNQSVITVVTCKTATKVQFVAADNSTMTFSKNSVGVTWQVNEDDETATWTIVRTFNALGTYTWGVRVFDNGVYTEVFEDQLTYTVSRPVISKFISISIDDNGQPIESGTESTITVVTHASATKVQLIDSVTGETLTFSLSSPLVKDFIVDNQAGTATWIIKNVFVIGDYNYNVKVYAQSSYSDIVENALQFTVADNAD